MLWQAVLTGLLLSADTWVAGAVYGRGGIRVGRLAPLLAGGLSAAAYLLAGSCSGTAARLLGAELCRWLGAGVLLLLGLHALVRARRDEKTPESAAPDAEKPQPARCGGSPPALPVRQKCRDEGGCRAGRERRGGAGRLRFFLTLTVEQERADLDRSKSLSAKEGLLLGAAMSLDAASAGLGAPSELLWATAAAVFLSPAAALTAGPRLGRLLPPGGRWVGGICLILTALLRLLCA